MDKKKISFLKFKENWLKTNHTHKMRWGSLGDELQRHFYIFDGVQVTENCTYPFSCLRSSSRHLLIDCVMQDNEKTKDLLAKYNGKLNTWCLYTEEQNVGVPQFDTDDDMLKFMYEIDYKSLQVNVTFF